MWVPKSILFTSVFPSIQAMCPNNERRHDLTVEINEGYAADISISGKIMLSKIEDLPQASDYCYDKESDRCRVRVTSVCEVIIMVDCIMLLSGRNSCRAFVVVITMSLDCELP